MTERLRLVSVAAGSLLLVTLLVEVANKIDPVKRAQEKLDKESPQYSDTIQRVKREIAELDYEHDVLTLGRVEADAIRAVRESMDSFTISAFEQLQREETAASARSGGWAVRDAPH